MTALANELSCPVTRKLIALLEERSRPAPVRTAPTFTDSLATLEIEAMASDAAPTTLTLIRIAKETTMLAERIALGSRRA